MPKPSSDNIEATHIESYLSANSDFAFEISVLRALRRLALNCRHGGTYEDPVTGKTRQFDIYAEGRRTDRDDLMRFAFAVEAKNLRPSFPLVVHRLPRDASESYSELMFARPSSGKGLMADHSESLRLSGAISPYVGGEPVGKALDQIGRTEKGEVFSNDQDVFEKMGQALNAGHELLEEAYRSAADARPAAFGVIVPVLVVPENTLWAVDYDRDGNITSSPHVVNSASFFVGKEWNVGGRLGHTCSLSHLDIVTFNHLETFIETWRGDLRLTSSAIMEFLRESRQTR